MGKFRQTDDAIHSVFGSALWLAANIKTIPSNFVGTVLGDTYIRVTSVGGPGINPKSCGGIVNIDIFTPAGCGPTACNDIADKLDEFLVTKSIKTSEGFLQFASSTLQKMGVCKDNSALHRSMYSIPFNYFGVI